MDQTSEQWPMFDEIDGIILRILADTPRKPYSEITEALEEAGHEMSTEGVRYRVNKILETTSVFFLVDPQEMEWELVRIAVTAVDEPDARDQVFELVRDLPFWHVSVGIGTYDVYAVGSLPDVAAIDQTLLEISEHSAVESVEHIIVTDRNRDMESYLNTDYLPVYDDEEE